VENHEIFIPHLYLALQPRLNFVKMFDADKTKIIGLPYGEKNYDNMLAVFIEYQNITDGQTNGGTDGQTDRFAISILRVSVRMHDNEYMHCSLLGITDNRFQS